MQGGSSAFHSNRCTYPAFRLLGQRTINAAQHRKVTVLISNYSRFGEDKRGFELSDLYFGGQTITSLLAADDLEEKSGYCRVP
jgi:hypothetical protein